VDSLKRLELNNLLRPLSAVKVVAVVMGTLALVAVLSAAPGYFVGDSADYYSLYIAWKSTLRPFMTDAAWVEYARRAGLENWFMVVPVESARHVTEGLRLGGTADFNHFWFYSLMAAILGRALELVHAQVQVHSAFLILHGVLLSAAFVLALRHHGRMGLAAAVLLTLLSPILWFVDKVHTEFMTYAAVLSATILFVRARYLAAACFLALASTQNISFAGVALVAVLVDLLIRRRRGYTLGELGLVLTMTALVLVHPVYYFFRHGTIEPQLLMGGAKPGNFLLEGWIWFLDPDLGLFANWPLAVGLALLAAWAKSKGGACASDRRSWIFFVVAYAAFGVFAASSTINLNSGGTRSIGRYATWYIPLFFPVMLMILRRAWTLRGVFAGFTVAILGLGAVYNTMEYAPARDEASRVPTPLSRMLQQRWPSLYDPPPQVFAARFSDLYERWSDTRALAVVGPDCHKVLVRYEPGATGILGARGCGIENDLLAPAIRKRVASSGRRSGSDYIRLDDDEMETARYPCPSKVEFGAQGKIPPGAFTGFNAAEPEGRWSDGHEASFTCWMAPGASNKPWRVIIATSAFVLKGHRQRVRVSINGQAAREHVYDREWEKKLIEVEFRGDPSGRFQLNLEMPDAVSPRSLRAGPDPRVLGVWIQSIEFKDR
jgi:hypothetical protein